MYAYKYVNIYETLISLMTSSPPVSEPPNPGSQCKASVLQSFRWSQDEGKHLHATMVFSIN